MPSRAHLALPFAIAVAGCAAGSSGSSQPSARVVSPSATANMIDAQGKNVGTASLVQSNFGGVLVLKLTGLPPGPHGLHIHTAGVCEPPAFTSAGPHLNPDAHQHGSRNPKGPHLGDLPNVTASPDGSVDTTIAVSPALLKPGVIGSGTSARALVVHAKADDQMTDPSGNSGDRIACGVLQR
jgi:Cu-Zn family superoxide dismutase